MQLVVHGKPKAGLNPDNARGVVRGFDVILDGSDNFATRYALSDACYYERRPLVSAVLGELRSPYEGLRLVGAPSSPILAGQRQDLGEIVFHDQPRTGIDVVRLQHAEPGVVRQNLDGVIALDEGLLVNGDLDQPFLHGGGDVLAEIECREIVLVAGPLLVDPVDHRIGAGRAEGEDRLRVGMGLQVGGGAGDDVIRVGPRVDFLACKLDAKTIGETVAALVRRRMLEEVVDAHEALYVRGLRLLAGRLARLIFRLADVAQRAHLLGDVRRAGIDDHDRDARRHRVRERRIDDIFVRDGRDNPGRFRSRRLIDQAAHLGEIATRRIAELDFYAHLVSGQLGGVADDVEERVRLGPVADEDDAVGRIGCGA